MKYFKRKKVFSHYSLDTHLSNNEDENDMQCDDDDDGMDIWDETDSSKTNQSKLPVVIIQKLHIGKNIYADGKFVGVAVFEENCDLPTSFIISSSKNLSTTSSDRKETSDLNKTSSELICTKYNYGTLNKLDLKKSSVVHSDNRPFACPKCSYKAKRKDHLKKHLLRHSNKIDSKIMVNNEIDIDDQSLEKKPNFNESSSSSDQEGITKGHTKVQGMRNSFKCLECDFETKYRRNLTRHVDAKHSNKSSYKAKKKDQPKLPSKGMRNRFNCLECDFTTKQKYSFERHVDKMHLNRLHCTDCDFTTSNKRSLESHLQRHRQNDLPFEVVNNKGPVEIYFEEGNEEEVSDCTQNDDNNRDPINSSGTDSTNGLNSDCKHTSENKGTVDDHLRHVIIGERPDETFFECSQCNFKTKRQSAFNNHTSLHKNKISHECPECDFETIEKSELDSHMLTHTESEEANYVKEDSGSEDELETKIGDNVRKQSNSRGYECPECSFKAKNARFLDSHVRTHYSKITVHECSVCSYRTKSKQNFRFHMFKHSNTIPKF